MIILKIIKLQKLKFYPKKRKGEMNLFYLPKRLPLKKNPSAPKASTETIPTMA
jgi:hypothetical protein